jgi:hypothetical protein
MVALDGVRVEAVGPQMAGPVPLLVDSAREPSLELAHRLAERVGADSSDKQMDVVGHQTIRPDLDPVSAGHTGEKTQLCLAIVAIEEDVAFPVAAVSDVVGEIRGGDACGARHRVLRAN